MPIINFIYFLFKIGLWSGLNTPHDRFLDWYISHFNRCSFPCENLPAQILKVQSERHAQCNRDNKEHEYRTRDQRLSNSSGHHDTHFQANNRPRSRPRALQRIGLLSATWLGRRLGHTVIAVVTGGRALVAGAVVAGPVIATRPVVSAPVVCRRRPWVRAFVLKSPSAEMDPLIQLLIGRRTRRGQYAGLSGGPSGSGPRTRPLRPGSGFRPPRGPGCDARCLCRASIVNAV